MVKVSKVFIEGGVKNQGEKFLWVPRCHCEGSFATLRTGSAIPNNSADTGLLHFVRNDNGCVIAGIATRSRARTRDCFVVKLLAMTTAVSSRAPPGRGDPVSSLLFIIQHLREIAAIKIFGRSKIGQHPERQGSSQCGPS